MSGNEKRALTPLLRFPEFWEASEWSEMQLGDAVSLKVRKRTKPQTPYKGLGIRSHGKGTFLKHDEAPEKNSMEYLYEVHSDDLIVNITFAWEGALAIASQEDEAALVSHRFPTYVFKKKIAIPKFFSYLIVDKIFIYRLGVISPGGAGRNRVLDKTDFLKLPVLIPSIEEQKKIADCLSSLDDLITAEAQKLDALKTHKKGLMQQLFPAEGETVPRLRFPEFWDAGKWKEETLSGIATIRSGATPLRSESKFYDGGTIPWVKTTDLNNSFIFHTEERITFAAKAKINPTNSVLVAMYGGFNQIGRTGYLTTPAATNQAISVLNPYQGEISPIYLLIWLNAKVEYWKRIASSSRKDPNITSNDVAKFPIIYPAEMEQQRIADCLSSLDDLITAQTQKLDALKTHKKGLMQHLFPNDIRTL